MSIDGRFHQAQLKTPTVRQGHHRPGRAGHRGTLDPAQHPETPRQDHRLLPSPTHELHPETIDFLINEAYSEAVAEVVTLRRVA